MERRYEAYKAAICRLFAMDVKGGAEMNPAPQLSHSSLMPSDHRPMISGTLPTGMPIVCALTTPSSTSLAHCGRRDVLACTILLLELRNAAATGYEPAFDIRSE